MNVYMRNIFIVIFCCFVLSAFFFKANLSPVVHAIPNVFPSPLPPIDDGTEITPIRLIIRVSPIVTGPPVAIPGTCMMKASGDADCNGVINPLDYDRWKCELLGGGRCLLAPNATSAPHATYSILTSDFNGDGKVTITDFEILRPNLYKQRWMNPLDLK